MTGTRTMEVTTGGDSEVVVTLVSNAPWAWSSTASPSPSWCPAGRSGHQAGDHGWA